MNAMLAVAPTTVEEIEYPDSDGEPMADNFLQFVWIVVLYGNLAALFRQRPDVFVGGNQNWYPRQGEPQYVKAPDVYAVFGRPKGPRPSWKQWEEDDVPMTVVFEILSPKNDIWEMADKLAFYDENGVEEYYLFDPLTNKLIVYTRGKVALRLTRFKDRFTSPRLGIHFDLTGPQMQVFYPDGRPFLPFEDLDAERAELAQQLSSAQQRADSAEQRADKAEQDASTAQQRATQAEQNASTAQQRADSAERRAERLAELSGKLLNQQATSEELEELRRLFQPSA